MTPYRAAKRTIDLTTALIVLVALSPVLLVLGLLIRAESDGPALYRQTRIGRNGTPFCMLKLRTMREGDSGTNHDESRVTPLGRFLRKYRLDELPQAYNIIRGEMSWIGPRPPAIHYAEAYAHLDGYHSRHVVRPGVTGWAQINQGHVTGLEGEAIKLSFDRQYIAHQSLDFDLLIALRTVPVILRGAGR